MLGPLPALYLCLFSQLGRGLDIAGQAGGGFAASARYIQASPAGPHNIGLQHGLHFTGGEPLMNFPEMQSLEFYRQLE